MKVISIAILAIALSAVSYSQERKDQDNIKPDQGSQGATACVILKRMGPADEVTSHLYSFGFRGKQFQYLEGELPKGIKFHGRLTDNDVRNIQDAGGKIVIIEPKYTAADLDLARRRCQNGDAAAMSSVGDHASDVSVAVASSSRVASASAPESGKCAVRSVPDGADILVDGDFAGNTPSTLSLAAGKHVITVSAKGFREWKKELNVGAGSEISLTATLEGAQ